MSNDRSLFDTDGFLKRTAGGFVNVLPNATDMAALEFEAKAKVCVRIVCVCVRACALCSCVCCRSVSVCRLLYACYYSVCVCYPCAVCVRLQLKAARKAPQRTIALNKTSMNTSYHTRRKAANVDEFPMSPKEALAALRVGTRECVMIRSLCAVRRRANRCLTDRDDPLDYETSSGVSIRTHASSTKANGESVRCLIHGMLLGIRFIWLRPHAADSTVPQHEQQHRPAPDNKQAQVCINRFACQPELSVSIDGLCRLVAQRPKWDRSHSVWAEIAQVHPPLHTFPSFPSTAINLL